MNNQGNFPNMGMNAGQMTGQAMQQNPFLNMLQNNLQGMNQQQRALFLENFQRNFQMMQQQANSGLPFQQQGMMGNTNPGLQTQMIQEFLRMQGNSQVQAMMGQSQGIIGGGNSQALGMMGQSQGITGSGNFQAHGMMGQSQGIIGGGNTHAQGMMGQAQGIIGSGNTHTHGMIGQSQGITGAGNFQSQGMMGQSQGIFGDETSNMMSMQSGLNRQLGQEQSFRGNQFPYETPVTTQQSSSDNNKLTQGVTQGKSNIPSSSHGQSLAVSKSPFVYTKSTVQESVSNKSEQNSNQPPKLKSILKKTQSASVVQSASATQSAKVSSSEKQTMSDIQQKAEKLKEMLSTYLYPSGDGKTSSKDSTKKQTGSQPGNKGQTVPATIKTNPVPASSITSNAKLVNVTNSTTAQSIKIQANPIPKVSSGQSMSSHLTNQSGQQSKVEGQSIPTLVSSGSRTHKDMAGKRKADAPAAPQVKKAKVTEVEEEDPEYVQAQVFISNIQNDTSKDMILDILRHYNFKSPQVWMGRHNSIRDQICAFVKLPSLKDSKRVITEMKGFPYKGKEMEIRFSAAADFIDYIVANDGMLPPQSSVTPDKSRNSLSGSSQIPAAHSAPPTDTRVPTPSVMHPVSGSAIPVETVPSYLPVIHSVDNIPVYPPVVHTVYSGVPPIPQEMLVGHGEHAPDILYGDSRYSRKDTDNFTEGSYHREYRRSISPRDRREHSPYYSPHRDNYNSPYRASSRDRRMSPESWSGGRHLSPRYSPLRRYSRSPDYSLDRQMYRRSRSRSPFRRDQYLDASPSGRDKSRDYAGYSSDDRYSIRDHKNYHDYQDDRGQRSSLSPDRSGRSAAESFCVHIEKLPPDIKDHELESLIQRFPYQNVRLKVRDGRASADIKVASVTEAKVMMHKLDGHRFMGSNLQVDWYREPPIDLRDDRIGNIDSMPGSRGITDDREHSRSFERERSRRSPERERSKRSPERERSKRSPERERSKRSPERERSKRSPERERSKRSPGRDIGEKSEQIKNSDWSKGARKSFFQSYIDASYPNAPILGRKYIKEFTSKDCNSAYYLCILCEVTLSWKEIADHMMGYKHRLKSIKRSHPNIYDKICLIRNKVDMLGQCAKYALELENKQEKVAWVDTNQPEVTAAQHLKKLQEMKGSESDRRENKKDKEDRKKKENNKDEKPSDSTSDIFKKIEAYKKKFEAHKDDGKSEESPAKRARTEDTKSTASLSFEDLSKQNKALADTIQKGITSARLGAEQKKIEADMSSRKQTPVKKGAKSSPKKEVAKKSNTPVKTKSVINKVTQSPARSKLGNETNVPGKGSNLRREIAGKSRSGVEKVSKAENNQKTKSIEEPQKVDNSAIDKTAKKDVTEKKPEEKKSGVKNDKKVEKEIGKLSTNEETKKTDDKTKKIDDEAKKITNETKDKNEKSSEISVEKKKPDVGTKDSKNESKKTNEETKKVSEEMKTVNEETKKNDKENKKLNEESKINNVETEKVCKETKKVSEETKNVGEEPEKVSTETEKVSEDIKDTDDGTKGINNETKKTDERAKSSKSTENVDDLVITAEDIEDLGKSISAELFSEELGDMEEEEEDVSVVVEEKQGPVKRKFSNNPLSKIEKFFEVQHLKDPEGSGIVGLQYVVEGIPLQAGKAHMYRCTLCNVRCATASIVDHILGYKHRMKYFEVHNFDIYSTIVKMDQSRKFLNAECSKHAKAIEEKEGLKPVMSLTEPEFKRREKTMNKERDEARRAEKAEKKAAEQAVAEPSNQMEDNKGEPVTVSTDKAENKPEVKSQLQTEQKKVEAQPKVEAEKPVSLAARIKEAKEAAKLVTFIEGKETVELYKYIQHKPDVPLLGLNSITEIQGLYGNKAKSVTYLCQLCCPFTKIDGTATIYEHLTGIKHMENYLKKHFSHKMIHLKLLTASSAKTAYLHNQAKLLCQGQLRQPESIYVVNIAQMEEEKAALELAKAAAKAVEEAAEAEKKALAEAQRVAMETANMAAKKISEPAKHSTGISGAEVIDLTGDDSVCETPVAHLYNQLVGLEDIPLVGLSYIVEVQGVADLKTPLRYECKLCYNDRILPNYINAHITDTDHRLKFLKANYPVFFNRALGNKDETEKLCREIEQQFGRESISVKKKISAKPAGSVHYSDPVLVKAPILTSRTNQHQEKGSVVQKTEPDNGEKKKDLEEGEQPRDEIVFNKIIEGLECTPLLGLQYIREVHHPTINIPPVYECDVCNIKNGPYLKTKTILKHICSKEHRLHFIRENHFHLYSEILALSTEEQRKRAIDKHTKEIESKVGRGRITRVTSDKPVYWSKSELSTSLQDSKNPETSPLDSENQTADENQPQYKCKKCSMILAKDQRVSHIIAMHVSCYKCKSCQLSFPDHFYLQKHMTLVHKSKQVAPNANMNHQYKMIKWFSWHAVRGRPFPDDITGRLQLLCKECNKVVPLGQAEHHYIVDHVKGYQCEKCHTPHESNLALEKHLQKQHNIKETIPVRQYTGNFHLSKRYIHVYSVKPPEVIDLTESTESKSQTVIKKYVCNRCPSLFIDGNTAEMHYKNCHFFEYPCTMCNYIFRVAVHLEKHYNDVHRVYRSVKTPVISFESCFHVLLDNGKKLLLDVYLKEEKITWKDLADTFKKGPSVSKEAPETTSATSVVSIATTSATTITIPNQQAGYYVHTETGQSSNSGSTSAKDSSTGTVAGPINLDEILTTKGDPLFDWETEHAKLQRRAEIGGITNCARKSKFMMNYTSTFSNYPLVGLQMMTEFQKKDISAEPWYICELCHERCNWKEVSPHIASLKHRIHYLEKSHTLLHSVLVEKQFDTIESLISKVETLSQGVVKKEGRQFNMKVMIELPPSEKEIEMLAEEQRIAQGIDAHLKAGNQTTGQIKTGTAKESTISKTPIQEKSSAQQISSSKSDTQKDVKTVGEEKKKLPAWEKIPRSSDKDTNSQDKAKSSSDKARDVKKETKSKSDSSKDNNKKYSSDSKRRDGRGSRDRSRERRRSSRSRSRDRDRRSSRYSNRSRDSDRYSTDRSRRRSPERSSRRDSKEDQSRKRRRSRSKDRKESKAPRTKSPKSGKSRGAKIARGVEKRNEEKKSFVKETAVEKETDSQKSVDLVEIDTADSIDNSENALDVDKLSLEELELISKSLEKQMEEEEGEDFVDSEFIIQDDIAEKEKHVKVTAVEKKSSKNDFEMKQAVEKSDLEKKSDEDKNENEDVVAENYINLKANPVEKTVCCSIDTNSTPENITKKETEKAPDSCLIEIVMTSHDKDQGTDSKINEVSETNEESLVNISIHSKETCNKENEMSVLCDESVIKTEKTVENTDRGKGVLDNQKNASEVLNPENSDAVESKIKEKEAEKAKSEQHAKSLDKDQCKLTEVKVDIFDNIKNSLETSQTPEEEEDLTLPSDLDELIASHLGEDFVTVDDADETSPVDIKISIPSDTDNAHIESETQPKENITEISCKINELDNNTNSNEIDKTSIQSELNDDKCRKTKQGDHKECETKNSTDASLSDLKSANNVELEINISDENIRRSSADTGTEIKEEIDEMNHEKTESVCIVDITMGPSVTNRIVAKKEDELGPYDDSGDIEFMLDEEFETVDETKDINTDLKTAEVKTDMEEKDESSHSVTTSLGQLTEKDIKNSKINNTTVQATTSRDLVEFSIQKESIKVKEVAANETEEKIENSISDNLDLERQGEDTALVITNFPMDEDDEDDIEEIFLGGDFITVDEHTEDEVAIATEEPEEEAFDADFNPDDFVTVDEVDTAGSSGGLVNLPSQIKEDKRSTDVPIATNYNDSSKNVPAKGRVRDTSKSRDKSISKESDRSSKDKSGSKKSDQNSSGSSSGSSRMRDRDKPSSSAREKRDRSNTSNKSTPEKSSRSTLSTSRTPDTPSAVDRSKGRQKASMTTSVTIGTTSSSQKQIEKKASEIEVNVQLLSKETVKELTSRSRRIKDRFGNYLVGQDGSHKRIDTQSFLGIPIKPSTASKLDSGNENKDGIKLETGKDSPITSESKPKQTAEFSERHSQSGSRVLDSKRSDLKTSNDTGGSRDEKPGRSRESRGGNKHSDNGKTREKGDKKKDECEISIEIG